MRKKGVSNASRNLAVSARLSSLPIAAHRPAQTSCPTSAIVKPFQGPAKLRIADIHEPPQRHPAPTESARPKAARKLVKMRSRVAANKQLINNNVAKSASDSMAMYKMIQTIARNINGQAERSPRPQTTAAPAPSANVTFRQQAAPPVSLAPRTQAVLPANSPLPQQATLPAKVAPRPQAVLPAILKSSQQAAHPVRVTSRQQLVLPADVTPRQQAALNANVITRQPAALPANVAPHKQAVLKDNILNGSSSPTMVMEKLSAPEIIRYTRDESPSQASRATQLRQTLQSAAVIPQPFDAIHGSRSSTSITQNKGVTEIRYMRKVCVLCGNSLAMDLSSVVPSWKKMMQYCGGSEVGTLISSSYEVENSEACIMACVKNFISIKVSVLQLRGRCALFAAHRHNAGEATICASHETSDVILPFVMRPVSCFSAKYLLLLFFL